VSKIFEALKRTESDVAQVAMSVLGDSQAVPVLPRQQDAASDATHADAGEQPPPVISGSTVRTITLQAPAMAPVLPFDGSEPRAAEQYRIIRTKIRHHPEQPRMLLVSSPMPGDGKTITALNLAAALALQESQRVLLVDCDFRRSSLTALLGLSTAPGLSEILRGEAPLESSLLSIQQFPNLYFLPPGSAAPNPSELLSTARWQSLIEIVRREFRFVVFDAPPVGIVAEYDLLQHACDGVVLVARQDHTNRELWRKTLDTVPQPKQLGVILNCVEDWFLWKTHSYYYYSGSTEK
jgi:capsular exopolysaccharide synthesis family protein